MATWPGPAAPSPASAPPALRQLPPAAGVGSVEDLYRALGAAARHGGGDALPPAETDNAVHAAVEFVPDPAALDARVIAARIGQVSTHMSRLDLPATARMPVNWSGFGVVIPVLAGSPGAGASVVAAALADALQLAGQRVMLVDASDPARSGLAAATAEDGPWVRPIGESVAVRYSWREQALLARLESALPVTPGMVPPPPWWLPELAPLHATVIDLGHDGWRVTQSPLAGAGGWLRRGQLPETTPGAMLVVRATRPSLRHAEQVLARLDRWVEAGAVAPATQLVVTSARRWPAGVVGVVGPRLAQLLESATFVPRDAALEIGGITAELVPDKVLDALAPLLVERGLLAPRGRSRSQRGKRDAW